MSVVLYIISLIQKQKKKIQIGDGDKKDEVMRQLYRGGGKRVV